MPLDYPKSAICVWTLPFSIDDYDKCTYEYLKEAWKYSEYLGNKEIFKGDHYTFDFWKKFIENL